MESDKNLQPFDYSPEQTGISQLKFAMKTALCDFAGGPNNSVVVAGTGRSGTTWVGEVLARASRSRWLFEPFLLNEDRQFAMVNKAKIAVDLLNYQLYIREHAISPYRKQIERILAGKIGIRWWYRREVMLPKEWIIYRRRVIKDIRANLFLGYLHKQWPKVPIVIVTRDPLSVINSQLSAIRKKGWFFDWNASDVREQPELMEDILAPCQDIIRQSATLAERLAHKWCIETLVPKLQLSKKPGVLFIDYRELLSSPALWDKIFEHCRLSIASISEFNQLRRSSSSMSLDSRSSIKPDQSHYSQLSESDIVSIARILAAYGLEEALVTAHSNTTLDQRE